ncbi:hypothetical protein BerOc1_01282 [Pseudodesulfovibrio hydrargyri]|uniref:Uncharacterized protein n=1 Tax=Pseudodesulfovibrio hydrargyri TaxID=2125990 RepID=A0A1J5MRW9_9BACT|nr:antitoxin Xre/MbcA/ParS toxin-binding domain-containing protein [Pseudodesulfovibrio hydrargyri]OIQ49357.1 hypothetical protein BerOc1_01282 [Pseudodesulfovibrio hydrargyri]
MPAARDKNNIGERNIPGAFNVDCVPNANEQFHGATDAGSGSPSIREEAIRTWLECQAIFTHESALLRLHEKTPSTIQGYIRKGFLPEEVDFTTQLTGLTQRDLTEKLGLSTRTLQRNLKEKKRLSPEKSDRLFRLQKLTSAALDLFDGNVMAMQQWIKTPLPVLNGESPISYSDTEPGAQFVLDLIDRLENGVFS